MQLKCKHFLLILFGFVVFQSCIKEIDTRNLPVEHKLVIYCMLTPDSLVSVRISKTGSVLLNTIDSVSGVKVELFENGTFTELLSQKNAGWFVSLKTSPVASKIYTIKATAPGFDPAEGTDSIPARISILRSVKTLWEINDPDHSKQFLDYSTYFSDPAEPGNYYELLFFNQIRQAIPGISGFKYYIDFHAGNLVVADPCLMNEDYINNYFSTFLFSDREMANQKPTVDLRIESESRNGGIFSSALGNPWGIANANEEYTALRSVSYAYYRFRKSCYKYISGQELFQDWDSKDPFSALVTIYPSDVFTNVKNGYGIVAAYQHSYVKTELHK